MFNYKVPPPVVTKEHGSWAVLIVPMLVNAAVLGKVTLDSVFIFLAALGVFMSYVPVQTLLRHYSGAPQRGEKLAQSKFWAAVYLCTTVGFVVPLLMKGYIFLLAIGLVGVISFFCNFLFVKHYSKMIATDLIAVAGLMLGGPSMYYVISGTIDKTALSLYLLNLLFFGCSVFYVHMKILASAARKTEMSWGEKLVLGKKNLIYYAVVLFIVGFLVAADRISVVVLAAFVPMVVQGVYGTLHLSAKVHFKRLGFLLLGQSILFGILVSSFTWR